MAAGTSPIGRQVGNRRFSNGGSWFVRKRAHATQIYFESGFPYGQHQYISAAATNWATQGAYRHAVARARASDGCILVGSAFLSPAAAAPRLSGRTTPASPKPGVTMLILIGVTLAVGAFVVVVILSAGRRSGLLELGAVSTQWLAEHREYQEGGRSR
jgi:hypothetical protein